jgi:uncharacterized protein (DUF1015 family)
MVCKYKIYFVFTTLAAQNKYSDQMKIYPFSASYPNGELISSADAFFSAVSKEYTNYKNAGFFINQSKKAFFIYRITGIQTFTGIIAGNDISDLDDNKILGHEHTIIEKEQNMLSLMLLRKAMIKPVLLAYTASLEIDHFIESFISKSIPEYSIELSNPDEQHTFWAIDEDEEINVVKNLFKIHMPRAYIADGHHRASVTARLVKKKYLHDHDNDIHPGLLCAFFPFTDLTIYDFNRVVQLPEYMSTTRFMAQISTCFDILLADQPIKPVKKHQITLYINQEWYILNWKESVTGKYSDRSLLLDVDLFNDYVLKDILNIADIKSATEIKYVEGVAGLDSLMSAAKNPSSVAFCLFALTKDDLINISDSGGVLPPKSTWFEPRMKNGMIIKEF